MHYPESLSRGTCISPSPFPSAHTPTSANPDPLLDDHPFPLLSHYLFYNTCFFESSVSQPVHATSPSAHLNPHQSLASTPGNHPLSDLPFTSRHRGEGSRGRRNFWAIKEPTRIRNRGFTGGNKKNLKSCWQKKKAVVQLSEIRVTEEEKIPKPRRFSEIDRKKEAEEGILELTEGKEQILDELPKRDPISVNYSER